MNANLDTAIQTLITKAIDGVDASVTFLQAEIPDYVYQLLLWYGVKSAIIAGVFFIVVVGCAIGCVKLVKYANKPDTDDDSKDGAWIATVLMTLFVVIPSVILFFIYALEALQIYIAPKVWLLEYASGLVE